VSKFRRHYKGITVQVHLPEEPMLVPMDPLLMQQVLFNLMENAARHGETVNQIDISLSQKDEWAILDVADNGVGIARGRLEHLFDGTLHPEEGREDARRDMGIGLSVCRTVVTAHGGTITAENQKQGGALFRITLPIE
jgi:two-component system sensor histidine kinase KdpD